MLLCISICSIVCCQSNHQLIPLLILQIVIGGRNKYLINGQAAQEKWVFRAIMVLWKIGDWFVAVSVDAMVHEQ